MMSHRSLGRVLEFFYFQKILQIMSHRSLKTKYFKIHVKEFVLKNMMYWSLKNMFGWFLKIKIKKNPRGPWKFLLLKILQILLNFLDMENSQKPELFYYDDNRKQFPYKFYRRHVWVLKKIFKKK